MNKFILITILIVITFLSQCTDNVSGSAQQGEAKVIGVIQDKDGHPVSNTKVYLLPSDFNPVLDSADWKRSIAYQSLTNDSGTYEFTNVSSGNYVLNGKDSLALKHIYLPGIQIEAEDLNLGINYLINNSYVTVSLNDSFINNEGYLYIEGTDFYHKLDSSNIITISVPSDTIDINFISLTDSTDKNIFQDIITSEGDTLDISGTPAAPIIIGDDSISIDSTLNFNISNYSDTIAYRFYWGESDTSQWILDSIFDHSWSSPGTYSVKAQARTISGAILYSEWSSEFLVSVLLNDSISDTLNDTTNNDSIPAPITPTGNDTVFQLTSETYSTTIWGDSTGLYEFRFNWGDSTISSWSQDTFATHSWSIDSTPKTFAVKSQARLRSDTSSVSIWSGILNVFVTF